MQWSRKRPRRTSAANWARANARIGSPSTSSEASALGRQQLHRIGHAHGRDLSVVTARLMLLDAQRREEKGAPGSVNVQDRDTPVGPGHHRLLEMKRSTLANEAKEAPSDIDVIRERAFQANDAVRGRVYPQLAGGGSEDECFLH